MTEEIMTNELKYSGRIAQIGIYFKKFLRMFVYQSDWKVLPMGAIIAALITLVVGKNMFVTMEGTVAEFIANDIKKNFDSEAEYQFTQDLREYILGRVGEVEFPEALLKRFMKLRNQDKDESYVEDNFKNSLPELLWHLAKEQICDQLEVKVQHEDVLETAKRYTRIQFAQYGMMNLPEETVTNYAAEMLKNEQQAQGLVERTVENLMAAKAKEAVTLKTKEVTMEEFRKLSEKK